MVSGSQALKFLENNTPDMILLDINMPEMDGFEVGIKCGNVHQHGKGDEDEKAQNHGNRE